MKKAKDAILEIRMLGGFTLSYEGKEIVLGRSTTSKFVQLLQMVWLQGEKGIAKDQLLKDLYDREEKANVNNSFNNLIYQMRRQMVKAGLPQADYISNKERVFFPDETIGFQLDALEFQRLMTLGDQAETEEEIYRYYGQAFELYKGELLPDISTELWVTAESFYYKELFERCVLWLGAFLNARKDYNEMYRIYSKAAELYPFDEWQAYQIEALLAKSDFKEAYRLYEKTARLYSEEMGVPPSDRMRQCYEMMSHKVKGCPGELSDIKKELRESYTQIGGEVPGLLLFLSQFLRCLSPAQPEYGTYRTLYLFDALYACGLRGESDSKPGEVKSAFRCFA